jgi:hypothetical protein
MRLRTLWLPIILLALAGCGEGEEIKLEKGPYLQVDRESLGFGLEFGSGTFIGTTGFNSLYLENRGDQPLKLTGVSKTGNAAFTLRLPTELAEGQPLVLESLKRAFIEVQFKPQDVKLYQGVLAIKWDNAGTEVTKEIALSGCGIRPPNDTLPEVCKPAP